MLRTGQWHTKRFVVGGLLLVVGGLQWYNSQTQTITSPIRAVSAVALSHRDNSWVATKLREMYFVP